MHANSLIDGATGLKDLIWSVGIKDKIVITIFLCHICLSGVKSREYISE